MKIKAYLKPNATDKIKLGEVSLFPKPTDLIVKTTHAGFSRGDVFVLENKWNATVYPAIGTSETIGIVEQIGSETIGFDVGDRVGIGYILGACMQCEYCQKGLHQYCVKQVNTELGGWGGFAEKVCVDYRLAVKIHNSLKSDVTAPLMCYGVTAYSGIIKAALKEHSEVGVIGLGGLGHLAVKILRAMNKHVTVFSHTEGKVNVAHQLGAKNFVLTTNTNQLKKLIRKFDLLIYASPADLYLETYFDLLKIDGKFCFLGLPFNEQKFYAPKLADYGSRSIYGSYVGSTTEIKELLDLALEHNLGADIISFPIAQFEKAQNLIKSGTIYERVVMCW